MVIFRALKHYKTEQTYLQGKPNIKLQKFTWVDGSEASFKSIHSTKISSVKFDNFLRYKISSDNQSTEFLWSYEDNALSYFTIADTKQGMKLTDPKIITVGKKGAKIIDFAFDSSNPDKSKQVSEGACEMEGTKAAVLWKHSNKKYYLSVFELSEGKIDEPLFEMPLNYGIEEESNFLEEQGTSHLISNIYFNYSEMLLVMFGHTIRVKENSEEVKRSVTIGMFRVEPPKSDEGQYKLRMIGESFEHRPLITKCKTRAKYLTTSMVSHELDPKYIYIAFAVKRTGFLIFIRLPRNTDLGQNFYDLCHLVKLKDGVAVSDLFYVLNYNYSQEVSNPIRCLLSSKELYSLRFKQPPIVATETATAE